jgi:hypothetical protein
VCALATVAGGCTSSGLPTLPAGAPPTGALPETGAVTPPPPSGTAILEMATMAQGSPTEVYSLVARGALRCWFGADGPLKTTHIFHADAKPPAQGGAAEIVLHERDGDQRGARAFRVAFSGEGSVRVDTSSLKIPLPMAELMARDVEVWAKGGSGCLVRPEAPAAPSPPAPKKRAAGAPQR